MDTLQALILGIIQGLTEFLPVSSSGHIELGKAVLGSDLGENDLLFTVLVHGATVLSTIVVFRKDILTILKDLFKFQWNESTQFAAKIIISMIPVLVVGVLFKDKIEAFFKTDDAASENAMIIFVGCMLLVTGTLLALTKLVEKRAKEGTEVSFVNALLIGLAQVIAILPGISRSGTTIATGLLLGVDKSKIARFSFLMILIPILGATLLDVKDLIEDSSSMATAEFTPLIVGFFAAFFAGLLACTWMINLVKKGKLIYFAFYCFAVGIFAISVGMFA